MSHPLDRPIWNALATGHAHLARGGELAKAYDAAVSPFAASRDDSPDAVAALSALASPGQTLVFLQAGPIVLPSDLVPKMEAEAVQMVDAEAMAPVADPRIVGLRAGDITEMLELATLTKPGPFTLRALELGRFWGVRIDGRLAAMAGERMRHEAFTELSGVCTHPDFRGGGLARLLSLHAAAQIRARGATPYLHAFANNGAAIRLYESIGFRLRSAMRVAMCEQR